MTDDVPTENANIPRYCDNMPDLIIEPEPRADRNKEFMCEMSDAEYSVGNQLTVLQDGEGELIERIHFQTIFHEVRISTMGECH